MLAVTTAAAGSLAAGLVYLQHSRGVRAAQTYELSLASAGVRAIFITGAASGIGLATVKLFLTQGWFVGLYDVNTAALERVVQSLPANSKICSATLDVVDINECNKAVAHFTSHSPGGRMDVLFNCAGLLVVGAFSTCDLSRQLAQVAVNFQGLVALTHAALPALKETAKLTPSLDGRSRVVNMASAAAATGVPYFAVYAATKHAVRAFTEACNIEWAEEEGSVGCVDVSVPFVHTPMVTSQQNTHLNKGLQTPDKWLAPEAVAELVLKACMVNPQNTTHVYGPKQVEHYFGLLALVGSCCGDRLKAKLTKQLLFSQQ